MAWRALIIDARTKQQIEQLKTYAETHRLNTKTLMWMMANKKVIGDDRHYAVNIPIGYRAVFTIEQQPEPMGWSRHISVSVNAPGRGPNPFAVSEILEAFGFSETPGKSIVRVAHGGKPILPSPPTWTMYLEPGGVVNVIEKIP